MALSDELLGRFVSEAIAEGLVDATFTEIDSPVGRLTVVQSARGVCRVSFPEEAQDHVLASISDAIGPRVLRSDREMKDAAERLQAYLTGDIDDLRVPVDMRLVRSEFQRQVLAELQKVGRGDVTTYGQLAARIGRPRAVRATGTALGRNPIPIVVPC
ncbi:MAG: methylated-DNA--[protein]-cysteine S-methyltransferase, partial [Actinomycetota bacterium]